MTGDSIKKLEDGFLDGTLTDPEEAKLRQWVLDHPGHQLAPYFQWSQGDLNLEVPNLKDRIGKRRTIWQLPALRIAAGLVIIMIAGYLIKPDLFESRKSYSQTEIDQSYEATMETLTAMSSFLNQSLKETQEAMDLSMPFEELKEIKNANTQ